MLKIPAITRTITYSVLEILTFNPETMECNRRAWTIPGDLTKLDSKELLAQVRETLETDEIKVGAAKVTSTRKEKRVISMTDFIKYSHVATKEDEENAREEEKESD